MLKKRLKVLQKCWKLKKKNLYCRYYWTLLRFKMMMPDLEKDLKQPGVMKWGQCFPAFLMPIFFTSETKLFILVRVSQPNSLSSNSKYVRFCCLATLEYSVFPVTGHKFIG